MSWELREPQRTLQRLSKPKEREDIRTMATKKKSFLGTAPAREDSNPAMAFISEESIEAVDGKEEATAPALKAPTGEKPPKGYKVNPLYVETKTKRLQLVLQPSLFERVKAASNAAGLSINEYCHRLLDEATKEEREG